MAELVEQRRRATARVAELEAQARASQHVLAAAREALVDAGAAGATAAKLKTLEQDFADAKAAAEKPWAERVEGARRAVRDVQAEVQRYVGDNLTELVAALEADGEVAAGRVSEAAGQLVAAFEERERIAREIGQLAALTGRVLPSDVSRSRAEEVVRAAQALGLAGGERPPTLTRDPREPRYGEVTGTAA
jgi:hypothetical protein